MAALSHSESRRKYSWWWDSHISPKNSKWLQENLTDMDVKVKSMIKLIEDDADSFARRAEMYYEKRPELIRLVEEFYRAYRALAERYNHATGELRHAHRALARAFPDHIPPSANSLDSEDDQANGKAEQVVWDLRAEKKGMLMKYHQCMEKLPGMEVEPDDAEKHVKRLDEKANQAEVQVQTLKEALVQLEVEKNGILVKCEHKIADLEDMLSRMGEDMKGLDMKAVEAESQARALKDDISRLEVEKEAIFRKYEECLGKILALEDIVSVTENKGILLREKAERAEDEVCGLKKALADLNEEREASALRYKCSLDKISKLEKELSSARENVECLNHDVLVKNAKLEMAKENCEFLERSNLSLKTEAENLAKRIATKDQELSQKQVELEKLTTCLGDENFHCAQVEATLQSLQNLHARSQDDQKTLKVELDNVLQTLKDLESNKRFVEVEVQHVRDENRILTQNNAVFVENMQSEILGLREIKQRLEKEMSEHIDLSDSLHKEIMRLKEEITRLNGSYHTIIDQLEGAGLSLNCFGTSVKCLRDENSNLRQIIEQGVNENAILSEKLANMQDLLNKTVISEEYMSSMNTELESSRQEAKALQESFQLVEGEKTMLVAEKASLLSQLETITETMHKLLEKNDVLENSLSAAKVELEGLREKSKGLEEICELLKNERSFLLNERGMLVSKLETVERKLKSVEKRYSGLEKKYTDLEKEKRVMHSQINELKASLNIEKHEWASSNVQNETKMAALKDKINFLQEENNRNRKEFEDELEKSLKAQFEIAILQKLIKDMEEKNCSLVIECQKHIEGSKLAEKLISELESEALEQQAESEILLDEIEQLRLSMYQIFRALETTPDCEDQTENELSLEHLILGNIEDLKSSVMGHEDDKELLRVENSVLLTLLEQLESKSVEIESQKMFLEEEIKTMAENLELANNDRDKVFDLNMKLKSDANESNQHAAALEAKIGELQCKNTDFHKDYALMKEAYSQMNRDNSTLLKMCCALKEEKDMLKQNDDTLLLEYLATSTESAFLSSFGEEKNSELNLLLMDLDIQNVINRRLEREMGLMTEKVEFQGTENLLLKVRVNKFERGIKGMRECNAQMEKDIVRAEENLHGAEAELLDSKVKLAAAEKLNLKMFARVDELEKAIQSSVKIKENLEKNLLELSENNSIQNMEMESLRLVKTNMDTELSHLRKELRDKILREQIVSSELQERNNELELWEAEASGYYFDLQMMSIHEVLLNSNMQELTWLYQNLEKENVVKTSVIEEIKGTTCLMEKEIRELKSELRSYAFAVAALRDDVTLLENNAFLQIKINSSHEVII